MIRERGDDTGSVSIVVCTGAGVVLSMGLAVAGLAEIVAARHAVAATADLAAVAAASQEVAYQPGCPVAAKVAALGNAELVTCAATAEGQVTVRVRRRLRLPGATVSAEARAGPVPPVAP